MKLILFPHYLHLAKIHHPQRTPQTSNSERCPWASMSLSAPLRNQLQLGHCSGPRANWRYCPCSPCSLSLSSAKFRKPHWLHTHEPHMAKMLPAGNPWLALALKEVTQVWPQILITSLIVSWPPPPSFNSRPFPYWLHCRGRNWTVTNN